MLLYIYKLLLTTAQNERKKKKKKKKKDLMEIVLKTNGHKKNYKILDQENQREKQYPHRYIYIRTNELVIKREREGERESIQSIANKVQQIEEGETVILHINLIYLYISFINLLFNRSCIYLIGY